jgi:hypothetical protein
MVTLLMSVLRSEVPYAAEEDLAAHSAGGRRTARTEVRAEPGRRPRPTPRSRDRVRARMGLMAFWRFGEREPANVEEASRIFTAAARDGKRIRGKLTLRFDEPQTQTAADKTTARCAQIAEHLVRDVSGAEQLIGAEAELASAIAGRLPQASLSLRSVEISDLQAVGERISSAGLLSPFTAPSRPPSGAPPSGPPPSQGGLRRPVSSVPPGDRRSSPYALQPFTQASSSQPPPSSSSLRWLGARAGAWLAPRPGSPPALVASALAPLLRDVASRFLIGCLRAHDLVIVRRVPLDPASTEILAALLPISDAPPGEFETSRAAEISRWHSTLGSLVLNQLRTEASVLSAFQIRMALGRREIAASSATEVVEALCRTAFPGLVVSAAQLARYSEQRLSAEAAESVARTLRHPSANQMRTAVALLLDHMRTEVDATSRLAKESLVDPA